MPPIVFIFIGIAARSIENHQIKEYASNLRLVYIEEY